MSRRVNNDRQENEVLALSNIYSSKEFSYIKRTTIQCYYNIFPEVRDGLLKLQNVNENNETNCSTSKCLIKYIPPIRMYIELPDEYPFTNPPKYSITVSWLSPWRISFICQKLDEMWLINKEQEILYQWFEFLRNDLLDFLQIQNILDISFLYFIYYNVSSYFNSSLMFQNDGRAIFSIIFSDPVQLLMNYHNQQCQIVFEQNYYTCIICFELHSGKTCIKLENCGHIYCGQCMQTFITLKLNENAINDMICPVLNCNCVITYNEIKSLCSGLFSKYEDSLLHITLRSMKNVIYCPRILCQCPVIKYTDDTFAICYKCDYTFCSYCYKGYHGATPCDMTSHSMKQLINKYESSNKFQRQFLAKKYGRKQIQIVVEKHLTEEYLKRNAKPCPNCNTMIEKMDGCNKLTCIHCKAYICWLCGVLITTRNAYDHFSSLESGCYKRLFD
ncbi:E3 ubiquitin-protein ligase RNF14 [Dufourea novaeangliae]|uniref:RBR-type E3 ubiquitin transferase n=1 Tax=Dufourea novaeangliae TaxID=178035 RepID=A0A154PJV8_DUFNO|nr:E3 ubiquitin-protein ligase RNF14 [Dufourea novaeangliae]